MTNRNQGGFGFGFDPDQIFGPQGILNQVFGTQSGSPPWERTRPPRPPFGPGQFGPGHGPGQRGGQGRRARRGDVRNAILHLLQREPMNGYQLMPEIAQSSGGAWQPSSGAIYPALAQLEDEGLVTQVEMEGRKAYQLTDTGQAAAQDLPQQTWAGGVEPDDPWAAGGGRGGRGRGRGRDDAWDRAGRAEQGPGGARRQRGAQLWKALGSVAMATQAVGQAGDDALSREAADVLDRTRRDLYRLLAEAEVARDESDDQEGDEVLDEDVTEGEIVDET